MAIGPRFRFSRLDWCLLAVLALLVVLGATKHLYHATMDRALREEIERLEAERERYAGVIALNDELEADRDRMRFQIELISCLKGRGPSDPVLRTVAGEGPAAETTP